MNSYKEKVKRESRCYLDCIDHAFELVNQKEFGKAAVFYENAARSLRELENMRDCSYKNVIPFRKGS